MLGQKIKKLFSLSLLLYSFMIVGYGIKDCFADKAKHEYLLADSCYKSLRKSSLKKKRASEWLKCINQYKKVYMQHPDSAWAPAGMYKSAQLYLTLSKLSGRKLYKEKAKDTLERIKKKHPKSAYASRSNSLLKKIFAKKRISKINTKVAIKSKNKKIVDKKKKKTSPKILTADKDLKYKIKKSFVNTAKKKSKIIARVSSKRARVKDLSADSTIKSLRFWSNPEYTRLVIDADNECDYSYRLLKEDQKVDKPFPRLYIDIEDSKLGNNVVEHTLINDNLLKQVRAAQHDTNSVRVVVDIKSFENYKIFSLQDPFRIVVDVWAKGTKDQKIVRYGKSREEMTNKDFETSDIAKQLALGVQRIVIDPGHGGIDPGAPGYIKNIWEKNIVLSIAKELSKTLKKRLNIEVVLTRTTDKSLELEARTAIANTKRADLFISLHCNAAKNKKLAGIETYILNLATDEQAIAVAARENATSKRNISDLEYILTDLMQHAKIEESTRLANVVHDSLIRGVGKKYSKIKDLGVKQAPFYVLLGARMPSILIETSFISNPRECQRLMNKKYQLALCNAITDGISRYIKTMNSQT